MADFAVTVVLRGSTTDGLKTGRNGRRVTARYACYGRAKTGYISTAYPQNRFCYGLLRNPYPALGFPSRMGRNVTVPSLGGYACYALGEKRARLGSIPLPGRPVPKFLKPPWRATDAIAAGD